MGFGKDYKDGRTDGTYVFERFGPEAADELREFLRQLDTMPLTVPEPRSLYFVAFDISVNQAIANSLS